MRIRTIKPDFFNHEELYDLEQETKLPIRIAFAGLWCAADRAGRFDWRPRKLKSQILPYDELDFSRVLDALTTRGFIQKYVCQSVPYGHIPSFLDHQVINNREKESTRPNPNEINTSDACGTREARVGHAACACTSGREGKGMEGNGREGNINKQRATLQECIAYAEEKGLPASDGQWFYDAMEAGGWQRNGKPIKSWKSHLSAWKGQGYLPSQKAASHRDQKVQREYPEPKTKLPR